MKMLWKSFMKIVLLLVLLRDKAAYASSDISIIRTSSRCPEPFVYIASKCYWFFRDTELVTRENAATNCENENSKLAHIPNSNIQQQLTQWINRHEFKLVSYWIGLKDENADGKFQWDNEEELHYKSWAAGHPILSVNQNCVVMSPDYSLNWKTSNCMERNLFICEKEAPASEDIALRSVKNIDIFCNFRTLGYYADPTNCQKYILCFGKTMYRYRCPENEIFNEVRSMCEIGDTECSLVKTTTIPPTTTVEETTDYIYSYETDSPDTDYEDDYTEKPDEEKEEEGVYPEYRCEGQGYKKHGKKCYKIFLDPVEWTIANQLCLGNERGRLVMIKNEGTQRFLTKALKSASSMIYDFWIGLNDQKTSETYVWSDGSVWDEDDYQCWSKRARKRYREFNKCVEISLLARSRWNDEMCDSENGYICEKDAIDPSAGTYSLLPKIQDPTSVEGLPPGWKLPSSVCGNNRRPGEPAAVVGGQTADIKNHPWQVSLRSQGLHTCGGSLIDPCWVLTAAHCVDPRSTGKLKLPSLVVLGDFDTSVAEGTEKYLPIARTILHPDWTAIPVPANDIALIEVGKCVTELNPVCLPGPNSNQFGPGDACKVAGWGTMHPDKLEMQPRLQEAVIPIIDQDVCQSKYQNEGLTMIRNTMFCAGYMLGGTDACQGDSGGPLACRSVESRDAVQWGIVSWGFGCARRNRPGVYTRITSYIDWIRNNTKINF